MTWIGTVSGRKIDFLDPDPNEICISDIACGLSKLPRFCGQLEEPYSVAQHCVECSYLSTEPLKTLLHDGSEALTGDCPSPLKELLGDVWRDIENRVQRAIYIKFGITDFSKSAELKTIDQRMMFTERRDFQPRHAPWEWKRNPYPEPLDCWPWKTAYRKFLDRFFELDPTANEAVA
jgi:hypothetical protein